MPVAERGTLARTGSAMPVEWRCLSVRAQVQRGKLRRISNPRTEVLSNGRSNRHRISWNAAAVTRQCWGQDSRITGLVSVALVCWLCGV